MKDKQDKSHNYAILRSSKYGLNTLPRILFFCKNTSPTTDVIDITDKKVIKVVLEENLDVILVLLICILSTYLFLLRKMMVLMHALIILLLETHIIKNNEM